MLWGRQGGGQAGADALCIHAGAPVTYHTPLRPLAAQERAAAGARPVKFNRLLLKFPTLHAGFSKCKAVFAELGGGGAGLGPEQLREGCAKLGYPVSAEAAAKVLASSYCLSLAGCRGALVWTGGLQRACRLAARVEYVRRRIFHTLNANHVEWPRLAGDIVQAVGLGNTHG